MMMMMCYIFFLAGKAILPDALIIQLWGWMITVRIITKKKRGEIPSIDSRLVDIIVVGLLLFLTAAAMNRQFSPLFFLSPLLFQLFIVGWILLAERLRTNCSNRPVI